MEALPLTQVGEKIYFPRWMSLDTSGHLEGSSYRRAYASIERKVLNSGRHEANTNSGLGRASRALGIAVSHPSPLSSYGVVEPLFHPSPRAFTPPTRNRSRRI